MQATPECNSALLRLHLHITHQCIVVGGDDHVHVLNGISKAGVHVLRFHLQLQNAAVDLVHEQAWPHTLLKSLAQDSFCLNGTTLDAIDHHHGTVGDSKSCSHL
eukprot:Skav201108  [mRNA]  locus=scaffold497:213386:213697:+ [translate_table: standard]